MNCRFFVNFFYLFICRSVWHVGCQFPDQGLNPYPLQWKCRVLTTGPPGNSLNVLYKTKEVSLYSQFADSFFFLVLLILFIWLHWVLVAACGFFHCSAWASLQLWCAGSRAHGLSCPTACGILVPPPGIKPMSPALEGGFLTTGLPGKFLLTVFLT